jgi:predicted ABC-type exoprotein transport system permease subunit
VRREQKKQALMKVLAYAMLGVSLVQGLAGVIWVQERVYVVALLVVNILLVQFYVPARMRKGH